MDNELILRQFEEIEEKVERLIEVCKSYEVTNSELRNKIQGLEEELQGKFENETVYVKEKTLIRSKIDSLLARLEGIAKQKLE